MHLPDNCMNEKGRKLKVKLTWVSRKIVGFFFPLIQQILLQSKLILYLHANLCVFKMLVVYFGSGCPEERPLGVTLQSQGPL